MNGRGTACKRQERQHTDELGRCGPVCGPAVFSGFERIAEAQDEEAQSLSTPGNACEASRGERTRTSNPRFWRPVLCQLSYAPGLESRV